MKPVRHSYTNYSCQQFYQYVKRKVSLGRVLASQGQSTHGTRVHCETGWHLACESCSSTVSSSESCSSTVSLSAEEEQEEESFSKQYREWVYMSLA